MSQGGPTEADFEPLTAEVEHNPPEVFARALIEHAVDRHATDLFISDDTDATVITLREMGELVEMRRLARAFGYRLQNHVRALCDADVTDHQHPASGRTLFQLDDQRLVDLRIHSIPSLFGQDVAVRIFEHGRSSSRIDQLGLFEDELRELLRLLDAPSGLLLCAGPTGSGKTHSLYAFLDHLNNGRRKIHTIEEPIEYVMPGIVQAQVNLKAGLDYPQLLHATLRQSPDVVMIGEIRDPRSAEVAIRAAASGQLVLASIHADSAAGAVHSLLSYGVNPSFVASSLLGVVGQRLVRRLCPACRKPLSLPEESDLLRAIREPLDDSPSPQLYVPEGCKRCRRLGFDRLICVPEILVASPGLQQAIAEQQPREEIRRRAEAEGMRTLREAAQMRIAVGAVCAEDVFDILPVRFTSALQRSRRLPETYPGDRPNHTTSRPTPPLRVEDAAEQPAAAEAEAEEQSSGA
jgi:type II secretory ATPase GspE/PulE/Tfp pilus assembly ATPase PilB-like protein